MTTRLQISRIRLDGGTQPRAAMNESAIADYAEVMTEGGALPPIQVYHDGECYWPWDGFHRIAAHKRIGALEIDCEIRQGTRRDAILASCAANAAHGLRRTAEDKRRVVQMLLDDDEWSAWSNRKIAKACGVGWNLVNKMRPSVAPHLPPGADSSPGETAADVKPPVQRRKVERNGSVYEMTLPRSSPAALPADPDASLEAEMAQAEAEVGAVADAGEVTALRARIAELEQTVAEMTVEMETLLAGADGDLAVEVKKLAARLATVERMRDDYQLQNATLKRELAKSQRRLAAGAGVAVHG